jgi:hypothetical protein
MRDLSAPFSCIRNVASSRWQAPCGCGSHGRCLTSTTPCRGSSTRPTGDLQQTLRARLPARKGAEWAWVCLSAACCLASEGRKACRAQSLHCGGRGHAPAHRRRGGTPVPMPCPFRLHAGRASIFGVGSVLGFVVRGTLPPFARRLGRGCSFAGCPCVPSNVTERGHGRDRQDGAWGAQDVPRRRVRPGPGRCVGVIAGGSHGRERGPRRRGTGSMEIGDSVGAPARGHARRPLPTGRLRPWLRGAPAE